MMNGVVEKVVILQSQNRNMKQEREVFAKYRIESEIGRGASGVCYRVHHNQSKEIYAMKKIHVSSIRVPFRQKQKQNTKEACSQVAILSKLDHPHIIKLYETLTDQNHLYIIMQYAPKGDLHHILKRRKIKRDTYSEGELWEMGRQIISALDYLHSRKIIHRDVKTLNIFMDAQGKLYLGDLGVSKILKADNGLYSRVGTPLYLAPEIIKYEKYDYKADIWGLGCVCYQLAGLTHPFEGKNIISLGQSIVNVQPRPLEQYSPQFNCFILDMLQKNPSKRLSACELLSKYFKDGLPPQVTRVESPKRQAKEQAQSSNMYPRSSILLKSNQIRHKIVNNFLEDKIVFNENQRIKEMQSKGKIGELVVEVKGEKDKEKINDKSFEETVVFSKRTMDANKKYVEATHKSYAAVKSNEDKDNLQWARPQRQSGSVKKEHVKSEQRFFENNDRVIERPKTMGMPGLSSEKQMQGLPAHLHSKILNRAYYAPCFSSMERSSKHKKTDTSLMEQQKKGEMNFSDLNRLSFEQVQSSGKITRMRPKSSIMTKDRHESTMKNIKKSIKRMEVEHLDRFVETQVLKQPEIVML